MGARSKSSRLTHTQLSSSVNGIKLCQSQRFPSIFRLGSNYSLKVFLIDTAQELISSVATQILTFLTQFFWCNNGSDISATLINTQD